MTQPNKLQLSQVLISNVATGVITSNVNLSSFTVSQTGITYIANDVVLLVGQSTASQNGLYSVGTVGSGIASLTRCLWLNKASQFTAGMVILISSRDPKFPNSTWVLTTSSAITLETTALTFIREAKVFDVNLFGAKGDGTTNDLSAIQAAVNAAQTLGGTVYFSVGTYGIQTTAAGINITSSIHIKLDSGAKILGLGAGNNYIFTITNANLTIEGQDRYSSTIQCSSGARTISLNGTAPGTGTGEAQLLFRNIGFLGNGGSSYLIDNTVTSPNFTEGTISFEHCKIWQFGATAIKTGTSVYYWRFWDCYFYQSQGSDSGINADHLLIGESCDFVAKECIFLQGYGPQIICLSERAVFDTCQFYGHRTSQIVGADIEFQPVTALNSGKAKIINCHFGGENEGFNASRSRIRFRNASHADYSVIPVTILGCDFVDIGQMTVSMTRSGSTITGTFLDGLGAPTEHGLAIGNTTLVYISSGSDATYNGTFTITATSTTVATWTNASATGASTTGIAIPGRSHAAIKLDNPVRGLDIDHCYFEGYATHILDSQSVAKGFVSSSLISTHRGNCRYGDGNRAIPPVFGSFEIFRNGGIDFTYSGSVTVGKNKITPSKISENVEIRNRIAWSEDFSHWTASGITVTSGQTDPFSGTTACLLSRNGVSGNQNISISINTTGIGNSLYIKFWAKSGTQNFVVCGVFDTTVSETTIVESGAYISNPETFNLDSTWRQYTMVVNGVVSGNTNLLRFLPAGIDTLAGTIYVAFVQVSDYDSSYYPTSGSVYSNSLVGTRLQNGLAVAGPFYTNVNVKFFGAVGDGSTNDTTSILAAYNHAASVGGDLYFPDGTYLIDGLSISKPIRMIFGIGGLTSSGASSPLLTVSANLIIEGHSQFSTILTGTSGQPVIKLVAGWVGAAEGASVFKVSDVTLLNGTYGIDASLGLSIGFYEGNFTIDRCIVKTASNTGISIGDSVYYSWVKDVQFIESNVNLAIGQNTETIVDKCIFKQKTTGSYNVTLNGPHHVRFNRCELYGFGANVSSDILLIPSADQTTGFSEFYTCKFGAEREQTLSKDRARIEINNVSSTYFELSKIRIRDCEFLHTPLLSITSISRSSNVVTATIASATTTHGLLTGDRIIIVQTSDAAMNGEHVVTSATSTTITYASTGSDVTYSGSVGSPIGFIHSLELSAIRLINPGADIVIDACRFEGYRYGVDDSSCIVSDSVRSGTEDCKWLRTNFMVGPLGFVAEEFKSGFGRSFSLVETQRTSPQNGFSFNPLNIETVELRNRLKGSDVGGWGTLGITKTTGQADAFGGTSAVKLSRNGSAGILTDAGNRVYSLGEGVVRGFDQTNLPGMCFFDIWAKAGTSHTLWFGILGGDGVLTNQTNISLGTSWKKYRIPCVFNASNGTLEVVLAPGGIDLQTGDCYVDRACLSDYGGAFVPNTSLSAGFADTAAGLRLERDLIVTNIRDLDLTTDSGTGQTMTIHAQNETGTSSTGGNLVLASGTGTSADGNLLLKTGSTTQLTLSPTTFTVTPTLNLTSLTASRLVVTDGSKNLISASTITLAQLPASGNAGEFLVANSAGGWIKAGVSTGADLGDASVSIDVSGGGHKYNLPAATLTTNRTVTLATTGATNGAIIQIWRFDTTANTLAIVNGGTSGGTLYTFPASTKIIADFRYDSLAGDWGLAGWTRMVSS